MNTQEVLIIRKGKMKVDLYTPEQVHMKTIELASGDLILLASGGHRFEMLEKINLLELKLQINNSVFCQCSKSYSDRQIK